MDNVIQFPGNKEEEQKQAQQSQTEAIDAMIKELELIHTQRKTSLVSLKEKIQSLLDNDKINATHMAPAAVGAFRDLISTVNLLNTAVDAEDKLIDFIVQDLHGTIQDNMELRKMVGSLAAFNECLVQILTEKEVLNMTDIKAAWEKMFPKKQDQ